MPRSPLQGRKPMYDESIKPGEIAYLVHSNIFIREVTVLSEDRNGMCSVRFTDSNGGIRVRRSRLFSSKEKAQHQILVKRSHHFPT